MIDRSRSEDEGAGARSSEESEKKGERRRPPHPEEPGAAALHVLALARRWVALELAHAAATTRRLVVVAGLSLAAGVCVVALLVASAFALVRGLASAAAALMGAEPWAGELAVGLLLPLVSLLGVRLAFALSDRRRAAARPETLPSPLKEG